MFGSLARHVPSNASFAEKGNGCDARPPTRRKQPWLVEKGESSRAAKITTQSIGESERRPVSQHDVVLVQVQPKSSIFSMRYKVEVVAQ
jgi:hypothetical protein